VFWSRRGSLGIEGAKGSLWLLSLALLAAFLLLGRSAASASPLPIDRWGLRFFGHATRLAAAFTLTGYAGFLTTAIVVACAVAAFARSLAEAEAIVIAAQLISQAAVRLVKPSFGRARPVEWLFRQELDFSYPSGHAVTAVTFYGGWLALVAHGALPLPIKTVLCVALSVWIAGIAWSRIALGAHHVSDVLGGALLGGAFLSAELALFP
jgi:membrane-associated phospholipid phosphatase